MKEKKKRLCIKIALNGFVCSVLTGAVLIYIWVSFPFSPPLEGQDGLSYVVQSSGEAIVMITSLMIVIGVAFIYFIISSCFIYFGNKALRTNSNDSE